MDGPTMSVDPQLLITTWNCDLYRSLEAESSIFNDLVSNIGPIVWSPYFSIEKSEDAHVRSQEEIEEMNMATDFMDSQELPTVERMQTRVRKTVSSEGWSPNKLFQELTRANVNEHILISPYSYGDVIGANLPNMQPFDIVVHPQVGLITDFHGHLCDAEVIGLLAGRWNADERCIYIQSAFPCTSTEREDDDGSTDVELDPVAELMVREVISKLGMIVVGWYHSHPQFKPDPSVTDINNQQQYQHLMRDEATGLEPFVGLIVSTYDKSLATPAAHHQWFHVVPYTERTGYKTERTVYFPMQLSVNYRQPAVLPTARLLQDETRRASMATALINMPLQELEVVSFEAFAPVGTVNVTAADFPEPPVTVKRKYKPRQVKAKAKGGGAKGKSKLKDPESDGDLDDGNDNEVEVNDLTADDSPAPCASADVAVVHKEEKADILQVDALTSTSQVDVVTERKTSLPRSRLERCWKEFLSTSTSTGAVATVAAHAKNKTSRSEIIDIADDDDNEAEAIGFQAVTVLSGASPSVSPLPLSDACSDEINQPMPPTINTSADAIWGCVPATATGMHTLASNARTRDARRLDSDVSTDDEDDNTSNVNPVLFHFRAAGGSEHLSSPGREDEIETAREAEEEEAQQEQHSPSPLDIIDDEENTRMDAMNREALCKPKSPNCTWTEQKTHPIVGSLHVDLLTDLSLTGPSAPNSSSSSSCSSFALAVPSPPVICVDISSTASVDAGGGAAVRVKRKYTRRAPVIVLCSQTDDNLQCGDASQCCSQGQADGAGLMCSESSSSAGTATANKRVRKTSAKLLEYSEEDLCEVLKQRKSVKVKQAAKAPATDAMDSDDSRAPAHKTNSRKKTKSTKTDSKSKNSKKNKKKKSKKSKYEEDTDQDAAYNSDSDFSEAEQCEGEGDESGGRHHRAGPARTVRSCRHACSSSSSTETGQVARAMITKHECRLSLLQVLQQPDQLLTSVLARNLLLTVSEELRHVVVSLVVLSLYYSMHFRRVDLKSKWRGGAKHTKIAASALVWTGRLGLRDHEETLFVKSIIEFLTTCWTEKLVPRRRRTGAVY